MIIEGPEGYREKKKKRRHSIIKKEKKIIDLTILFIGRHFTNMHYVAGS